MKTHGYAPRTYNEHGKRTRNPTYATWIKMRGRCENPKNKGYAEYGGRGITVCERWKDFANFVHDMGDRPDGSTIDRIENNIGYEPGNCRWANILVQNSNRRVARVVSFNGEHVTVPELSRRTGIKQNILKHRIHTMGLTAEQAVEIPVNRRSDTRTSGELRCLAFHGLLLPFLGMTRLAAAEVLGVSNETLSSAINVLQSGKEPSEATTKNPTHVIFNGRRMSFRELRKVSGSPLSISTIRNRIILGWTVEDALSAPIQARNPQKASMIKRRNAAGCTLSASTLRNRLWRGLTEEDAMTRPLYAKKPRKNTKLESLTKLRAEAGCTLPIDTLAHRIWRGWTVEEAMSTPLHAKKPKRPSCHD